MHPFPDRNESDFFCSEVHLRPAPPYFSPEFCRQRSFWAFSFQEIVCHIQCDQLFYSLSERQKTCRLSYCLFPCFFFEFYTQQEHNHQLQHSSKDRETIGAFFCQLPLFLFRLYRCI